MVGCRRVTPLQMESGAGRVVPEGGHSGVCREALKRVVC